MKQYLVLDFGGTYTKYALMDKGGAFLEQGKVPSQREDLEHMMTSVAPLKEKFAGRFEGVAVSMPGRTVRQPSTPSSRCWMCSGSPSAVESAHAQRSPRRSGRQ